MTAAQLASLAAAAGVAPDAAAAHMLVVLMATAAIAGLTLLTLGILQLGNAVRFIPYPVVSGFVAGTGVILCWGAAKLALGRSLTWTDLTTFSIGGNWLVFAASITFAALLQLGTRYLHGATALPLMTVGFSLSLGALLWLFTTPAARAVWFPRFSTDPVAWSPLSRALWQQLDWSILGPILPETTAIAFVLVINLVGKMTGLETVDARTGDLNKELRTVGSANLLLLPFGATPVNLWGPSSRVPLKAAGGTRESCFAVAMIAILPFIYGGSLVRWIPIPIMAGFLFFGAYSVLVSALRRTIRQRRILDLALLFGVAIVCLRYGYLVGVLIGITGACLQFALSYSQVKLVRRHMTRHSFAGNIEREAKAQALLNEHGDAIQIFWLSGYIFFGSIEGLFTAVRTAIAGARVQFIVLDFADVSGADASAMAGLTKVRALAERSGVTLVFTSVRPELDARLRGDGLLGGKSRHVSYATLVEGLAFAEQRVLAKLEQDVDTGHEPAFGEWLTTELGRTAPVETLNQYFEKRDLDGPRILYEAGAPAETIDLIEAGRLTIAIADAQGIVTPQRTMLLRTVVGEMGFFRSAKRSASVLVDGPTTVHTLTRAAFERMQRDHPELALAFNEYIIRTLTQRLVFANRTYAALV